MTRSDDIRGPYPTRAEWEALGTSVVLLVDDPDALATARAIVERELRAIDRACSRFRPDSDLQRVNAGAGRFVERGPAVDRGDAGRAARRRADRRRRRPDGRQRARSSPGYDRDWIAAGERRGSAERSAASSQSTGGGRRSRRASRPGGGRSSSTASAPRSASRPACVSTSAPPRKRGSADRAAAAVHEATGAGSLIGLGGDIATAGAAPAEGWRIYVTDDHRRVPGEQGQTISIRAGGLATSSTTARRWRHEGRTRHHIIDPATGAPVAPKLAHGERRRGDVPGCEHRQHRRADPRGGGPGVAGAAGAARAPGRQ